MTLPLADILEATGGHLVQGAPRTALRGVSTDSRTVRPGQLFVAIAGERFDGHAFVGAALAAGAAAVLVERWPLEGVETDRPVVQAPATVAAYGQIAARWRARMPARVVGITGSNGKTTTKELVAHLLGQLGPTAASEANHNNHIGVPETLLRVRPEHRFAVVEMGTNHPGELEWLARLVRPDVAVITNIGPSHLEAFGDERGVAREKGRLLDFLAPDGLAVFHTDDEWSRELVRAHAGRKTTFGLFHEAQWRASALWPGDEAVRFRLIGSTELFEAPLVGGWQVSNCLAALAVAAEMGLHLHEAAEALKSFVAPKLRMTVRRVGGLTLILDCYNANPMSMAGAIEELRRRSVAGRRVALLGDMLELGRAAEAAHRQLGKSVAEGGIDLLCVVGDHAERVAAAARRRLSEESVFWTRDRSQAAQWLCTRLQPGDTVLAKGSRAVRLEEVTDAVEAWAQEAAAPVAVGPGGAVAALDGSAASLRGDAPPAR